MQDEIVKYLLRLPKQLHKTLAEWAKAESRSLNSQIIYLLQDAVRKRPPKK